MLLRRRRGASALTHCGRSARRHPREGGERRRSSAMLNEVPACAGMTKLRDFEMRGTPGGLSGCTYLDVCPTTRGPRPTWGAQSALWGAERRLENAPGERFRRERAERRNGRALTGDAGRNSRKC